MIYAYEEPGNKQVDGLLKVGYTAKLSVQERVAQQFPIKRPVMPYRIVVEESAMRQNGSAFSDRDVRNLLIRKGFANPGG